MFSINYLYSIRNNFAIIYSGIDAELKINLLHKFRTISGKYSDMNIHLFILGGAELSEANVHDYSKFVEMKNMFPKYFEVYKDEGLDKIE